MPSIAPQTLIDLKLFLVEQFGIEKRNVSIRGRITTRRPWGYHLGRAEIFGPDGLQWEDYSLRYRRDRDGLSNASAGIDARLPQAELRKLVAYLVGLAASGSTNPGGPALLTEIYGPDEQGKPKRWSRSTDWRPVDTSRSHEWHIHLSFYRDTELIDKRPMFFEFFGIDELDQPLPPEGPDEQPEEPTDPLPPEAGEPEPPEEPEVPELDPTEVRLADAEEALEAVLRLASSYFEEYPTE